MNRPPNVEVNWLSEELAKRKAELETLAPVWAEVQKISLRLAVTTQNMDSVEDRMRQLQVELGPQERARARVVSAADLPSRPLKDNRRSLAVLGSLLGLVLGFGATVGMKR